MSKVTSEKEAKHRLNIAKFHLQAAQVQMGTVQTF